MEVTLPKLEKWQQDLFTLYQQNSTGKWIVVKSRRQVGKSICLELLLLYVSLLKKGSFSLFVSPVIQQARKVFKDVCNIASEVIKSANASILEIEFVNGSVVKFGSAQQADSLRGFTVSGLLLIDEAAFITDDIFYQILVPTTNVNNTDIFIVSTPKQKQGFFYELFTKGLLSNGKIISVDWNSYDTTKYLSYETLELYRQQMPKLAFQCEFMAEFIDSESAIFGDFRDCMRDNLSIDYGAKTWIGIDWGSGSGQDDTAIAIGQFNGNVFEIKDIITFNDKNVDNTIKYIVNLVNKFNNSVIIQVEQNSIGKVFFQLLYKEINNPKATVSTFNTTNKSKDKIIKQLAVCFEQKKITIPNDNKLRIELEVYECTTSSTGLPVYNARQGFKDDMIMASAILINLIYYNL